MSRDYERLDAAETAARHEEAMAATTEAALVAALLPEPECLLIRGQL